MRLLLLLLLSFSSILALAQTQDPPKIIKEQSGNITSYHVEGNLASTQTVGCIPLSQAKNTFTPADLYRGVVECLAKDNYEFAVKLFALAGIYAQFDAERVTDKSARTAKAVLIMGTFSNLSQDKKTKFSESFYHIVKTPELLGKLCGEVQHIGMPNYYPRYMILHGMKAFRGNPYEGALVKDFDSSGAWKELQSRYLHCPS